MSAVPDTIEAEVLEIDGSPAPVAAPRVPPQGPGEAWRRSLQGKVFRLDKRWWPLWVLLGIVAVVVFAVVAVFVAIFLVMAKILGGILRFLTGAGPRGQGSALARRGD
ncbi:hypothetical protein [Luteolibacter sp. Populi]|uniref:hypothetical protein n=1 Tax=Luteolibacter sp. Populi TaxID=3230487 RepID=UPI0034655912